MSKNFLTYYLEEADKEYVYKLKFACDDFTDEMKDKLEMGLERFDLKSIEPFKNTPIQESPLDFPNVRNCKVFVTTITLAYPASHDMLRQYVAEKTGMPMLNIAVYSQHDPREHYTDHLLKLMDDKWREDYVAKLGSDYEEGEDVSGMYGKAYNDAFLSREEEKRKERKTHVVTNDLIPEQVIDNSELQGDDVGEHGGTSVLGGKK